MRRISAQVGRGSMGSSLTSFGCWLREKSMFFTPVEGFQGEIERVQNLWIVRCSAAKAGTL